MITSGQCLSRFGRPDNKGNEAKALTLWQVPAAIRAGKTPAKIYCNKLLIEPLSKAFKNIVDRGLSGQFHSFDGCFNIRVKRGGTSWSMHAWGLAVDINASTNQFGHKPTMSPELVKCFTDTGLFDWGGVWSKPDGMHFQLKNLP